MRKNYNTRDELMNGLAEMVAAQLAATIESNGRASFAAPGGLTPAPFLRALSNADIAWDKVEVMLGDERFVDENSDRSNTKLLRENLLQNRAAAATMVPLRADADTPEEVIESLIAGVTPHLPIDVLVVGMGEDMHTASLFPDSANLADTLADDAPVLGIIRAENAGEPRITLTAPVLRAARFKHVLLAGANKIEPLERALSESSDMIAPIRVVIAGENPATIHYAD